MPLSNLSAQDDHVVTRTRLAAIVRSSADAIIGETLDGIITDWNPAAERLYGYAADEVIGQPIAMLIPPERMAESAEIRSRARRGEHVTAVETVRWTKDGRRLAISLSVSPVWNDAGEIIATSAIVRDITDRNAAVTALAASESLFRVVFENAPIGMVVASPDLENLQINQAMCAMLGYGTDELFAPSVWTFTHPEDVAPNLALMRRALAGEIDSYELEMRYIHKDGHSIWAHLSGSLVRDAAGAPLYFVSQIQDITAGKAADAAIRASEERFRSIFTGAGIGMALVSLDGTLLVANPALETLLGYAPGALVGMPIDAITLADDLGDQRAYRHRMAAGELQSYQLEKRFVRKDGGIVWGLLDANVLLDDQGQASGVIGQVQDITERKEAEAELSATHQNTRQVLERITDGFYALDREWCFTYINTAAEQMLDRSRETLLGQRVWDAFPPAIESPLYAACQQAMAEKRTVSVEFFYPPLSTWLDVRAYPSADGLSVFFRDVTDSRRLAEELREAEAKYRTLVEQLPGAVYLLANDEKQTPLYFSPYIKRVTGETPEEAMAFHDLWLDLVHPEDRERVAAADARHGVDIDHFRAEYRHRHKDGGYIWVHDECLPVHDASGQVVAWQGVMFDITDRIAATEAQGQLAALVESAEDAVIGSIDGTITSWNRGAERLYGYRAEEIIGQSFRRLVPSDLVDPSYERLRAAVTSGVTTAPFETRRLRRDGTTFAASVSLSPIRDHSGRVIGISSITRDITERKQAEEALREALQAAEAANEAKSAFLAMMSHELLTPLQAVLGYAEFLLADPAETFSAEQREDLTYIHQGGRRMLGLITELLDLSRIEAGRLVVVDQALDLAEILEQVRQDATPQAVKKGLKLSIEVPPTLPAARGDPERLRQVLLNLVGNAVKFTDQGSVSITAERTADGVAILVRDTGIGIAPEALPHIFEYFHQVDSRLSRRHGGAGLGLAIAQKLTELMNGRITVASQPGIGSTFTIHLATADASATPSGSTPAPTMPATKIR